MFSCSSLRDGGEYYLMDPQIIRNIMNRVINKRNTADYMCSNASRFAF